MRSRSSFAEQNPPKLMARLKRQRRALTALHAHPGRRFIGVNNHSRRTHIWEAHRYTSAPREACAMASSIAADACARRRWLMHCNRPFSESGPPVELMVGEPAAGFQRRFESRQSALGSRLFPGTIGLALARTHSFPRCLLSAYFLLGTRASRQRRASAGCPQSCRWKGLHGAPSASHWTARNREV
jgi:hypothetical protein